MINVKTCLVTALIGMISYTAQAQVSLSLNGFLSRADHDKIRRAVDIMNQRMALDRVTRCAAKYTTRSRWMGGPIENDPRRFTQDRISLFARSNAVAYNIRPNNPKYNLIIDGESMGPDTNGRAKMGISYQMVSMPRFEISLNRDTVSKRDVAALAGTIFHEILHNIGWDHGTGDYDVAYEGFLIKEWQRCIAGNGQRGSGLTADPYEFNHE